MTSRTPIARGARKKSGKAASLAAANRRKAGDILTASSAVAGQRLALGAAAMIDPSHADTAEFAKILPEKAEAAAEAGSTWLGLSGEMAAQVATYAAGEMANVAEAAMSIRACRTPLDVIAMQNRFAAGWFARAVSRSVALGTAMMRSQGAAMTPYYRIATANARRLG